MINKMNYSVLCSLVAAYLMFATQILTQLACAQDDQSIEMGISSGQTGVNWQWTPSGWIQTSYYSAEEDFGKLPDQATLKKLVVQWQTPTRSALGNTCTVSGQLFLNQNNKKTPVNWRQGVTVFLAKHSGASPDWSAGMQEEDTGFAIALANAQGKFAVSFNFREDEIDCAREGGQFQFGLALAEQTTNDSRIKTVKWKSEQPVINSSVVNLTIPATTHLSNELHLINEARDWPFQDPDTTKLIRAVNALQPLGKEQALKTLEKYIEMRREVDEYFEPEIVFWIIRVLFEPIELDQQIPTPGVAVFMNDRHFPKQSRWPLNPMALVDDIPFMLGSQIGSSGIPEFPSSHINFARTRCVIRDKPLRPTRNPIAVAQSIFNNKRFTALRDHSFGNNENFIREQAIAMVADLVGPLPDPYDDIPDKPEEEVWESKINLAKELGIQWNTEKQKFILKGDQ